MSNTLYLPSSQRGVATIFVTMVLLILITLMVVTAWSLSNLNLKVVGNLQTRKEATASAQRAIELVVEGMFWNPAVAQSVDIDIDNDDNDDYTVDIAVPTCLRATQANIISASSVNLPGFSAVSAWNTIWVLDATARDLAASEVKSGTQVRVRQGVRVLMSETDKDLYCPAI